MENGKQLLEQFKNSLKSLDPVYWCETNLTVDRKPFRLRGGWEPYLDIYRYLGVAALTKKAKPVIFVKGRQVGGTFAALAIELFFLGSGLFGKGTTPPIRIMHCFPQLEMAQRFSKTKFNTTIATSKLIPHPTKKEKVPILELSLDRSDSLTYKEFKGGNHIFIESTGLTADRLRGITADIFLGDEIQDMKTAAISNTVKSLTQAQYGPEGDGVQFLFGTPKKKGSDYHKRWLSSTQQYYHLGCEACDKDFPLYTPGSNKWEEIWIEDKLPENHKSHGFIVRCTHCGHEQDKREAVSRGKWVAYNEDPNAKYIGYHLNQLYIPHLPRWKIIGEKPENHPVNTERAYQNEVLGEFYSGSSQPITSDEIDQMCGDHELLMASKLISSPNRKVFLGLDWGLKIEAESGGEDDTSKNTGKSFSVATVLVQEGPKLFKIAYAERMAKNDLEYKIGRVDELMRKYNVDLAVGDIGFGYEICRILQKKYPSKFLPANGLAKINNKFRIKDEDNLKMVLFEKDYLLEQMFEKFKRGEIKFPYKDYEKIAWLVEHCASMDIKVTYDMSGEPVSRYVKGNINNDGLMSLTYAYLGSMCLSTNFFEIKNPENYDFGEKKKLPIVLGYAPHVS